MKNAKSVTKTVNNVFLKTSKIFCNIPFYLQEQETLDELKKKIISTRKTKKSLKFRFQNLM